MKISVSQEIYLHTKCEASVYEIGELLERKPNSVLVNLRNHGVLRKAMGRDIEEEVAQWFEKQGLEVKRQRGDAPFDLSINNERIDVKSAHLGDNNGYPIYRFQLQDLGKRVTVKRFSRELDSFIFVLLDEDNSPMYKLSSSDITNKVSISFPKNIFHSKYSLHFIGYLRSEVNNNYEQK